jgi:hypothetical protein
VHYLADSIPDCCARWADGFDKRFGLHYVDYRDPKRARYAKDSARWYHDFIAEHGDSYLGRAIFIPPLYRPVDPVHDGGDSGDAEEDNSSSSNSTSPIAGLSCDESRNCSWLDYWLAALQVNVDSLLKLQGASIYADSLSIVP